MAAERIEIGDACMIAHGAYLSDADWHGIYDRAEPVGKTKPIVLKDNVWIGDSAIICKGVTIGKNSIIGAGAVVTKNVLDNAIIYNSMIGFDQSDELSKESSKINLQEMQKFESSNVKIGYSSRYLADSLFMSTVNDLQSIGINNVSYTSSNSSLPYFRGILTSDMKRDLPKYIYRFANEKIVVKNVSDIVKFNNTDTITHAPYNQNIFIEIVNDSVSDIELKEIKKLTLIKYPNRGPEFLPK